MAWWTYRIHYSCCLQYLIDLCQGHLDRHSSLQNWPITASKLDICKMQRWRTVLNNVTLCCTLLWEWNVCTEEPNDTCLLLIQPETDSLNTALTFDLFTFECRGAGIHCFSSCLMIWINPTIIKHSHTSVVTVIYPRVFCMSSHLLILICIIDTVKHIVTVLLWRMLLIRLRVLLFMQLKIVIASSLAVANGEGEVCAQQADVTSERLEFKVLTFQEYVSLSWYSWDFLP